MIAKQKAQIIAELIRAAEAGLIDDEEFYAQAKDAGLTDDEIAQIEA